MYKFLSIPFINYKLPKPDCYFYDNTGFMFVPVNGNGQNTVKQSLKMHRADTFKIINSDALRYINCKKTTTLMALRDPVDRFYSMVSQTYNKIKNNADYQDDLLTIENFTFTIAHILLSTNATNKLLFRLHENFFPQVYYLNNKITQFNIQYFMLGDLNNILLKHISGFKSVHGFINRSSSDYKIAINKVIKDVFSYNIIENKIKEVYSEDYALIKNSQKIKYNMTPQFCVYGVDKEKFKLLPFYYPKSKIRCSGQTLSAREHEIPMFYINGYVIDNIDRPQKDRTILAVYQNELLKCMKNNWAVIVDYHAEGDFLYFIHKLEKFIIESTNEKFAKNNVVLFTSNLKPYSIVDKNKSLINIIYSPFLFSWNFHFINEKQNVNDFFDSPKEKKFICLNRLTREHRMVLTYELHKRGLVDSAYYSFFRNVNYVNGLGSELENITHIFRDSTGLSSVQQFEILNYINTNVKNLYVDNINPHENKAATLLTDYINKSYLYVVTETFFYETEVFLTEKIIKPIITGSPFILVGPAHGLAVLKEFGFKTFSGIIDESYDAIINPKKRMKRLVQIIENFCKKSDSELNDFLQKAKPICEYNFQHYKNNMLSIVSKNGVADSVLKTVYNNILLK